MTTLSPPTSPQPREQRPRPLTQMSYASTRSHRSSHSGNKLDLTESTKDKRRLEGKADPTKALHEAQPAVVALEDSNLENIRMIQHRDFEGNVITDPDRSNPTRARLERPLDTIRAFNAAADGTSSRRSSYQNRPPPQTVHENRRTSYYGGAGSSYSMQGRPPRHMSGGYYRTSSYGPRPESFAEDGPQAQYSRPGRYQPGAPYAHPAESPSSFNSQHPSYETMTSGSDEHSKSTNPSSQNSSFDHLQMAMRKPDEYSRNFYHDQENGHSPMQNGVRMPPHPAQIMRNGNWPNRPQAEYGTPPAPPPKQQPIRLSQVTSAPPVNTPLKRGDSTKRQSWLKRKFSRKA